jgi:hypothetical protein
MPMAMQTITPKAPRSGSSSSRPPTSPIATIIGRKPLVSLCMYSCLRTVKSAAYSTTAIFMISDGCSNMTFSGIQRRAPLTEWPMPGISTITSNTSVPMNIIGAHFCHMATGTWNTTAAATIETMMYIIWRYRKYSFLSFR